MKSTADAEEDGGSTAPVVAVMQPYFLPYIGYFQLIREADVFVVYDNIKYTKKGWINRNRMLRNDEPAVFSLPLTDDSDLLDVRDRVLSPVFDPEKLLAQIHGAYRKAPCFNDFFPVVADIIRFPSRNLFEFVFNSIESINKVLQIETPLVASSSIDIDHAKRGQDRVLAICKELRARTYLNPPGGRTLYSEDSFSAEGLELAFLAPVLVPYDQFGSDFVPALSILDILMFNSIERVLRDLLPAYDIVRPSNA